MRRVVRSELASAVCGRKPISAPSRNNRSIKLRGRVSRFDSRTVRLYSVPHLVICSRLRMHISVGTIPEIRLVVEKEMSNCSHILQMCYVIELPSLVGDEGGVQRVVSSNIGSIRSNSISTISLAPACAARDRTLISRLRTIFCNAEATFLVSRRTSNITYCCELNHRFGAARES